MITLNVFFKVKKENKAEFLKLLENMVTESNQESGCSFYQLWQNHGGENNYVLIEHWDNADVLAEHQKTPHWIEFDKTVNSYLEENYDEHHYEEIPS
ncbi:antibiotic biosynthesis monooxygenase [Neisseriaceae bacterium PsAf]|nr:antibiotic biosynthesis monooxygenase [Neisseriaceae bacterium PsAf]MCV2502793.1 antibiotic biosynthesis monooxygenase [Neisseriaceae bacterium]